MSPRNPTFIVSNGKGSSYLFRTIIPRDIRNKIHKSNIKPKGSKEIRISLLTGLKSEAKRLSQVLKIKADAIFEDIRSGNNSVSCVEKIKGELKAHLYQIRTNGHNGGRVINEPDILSQKVNFNYYRQPMERKLTEDYIRQLKFQDFKAFCEAHDIEYKKEDYPQKGIQLKRLILSKKVGEEIGYLDFAKNLAGDILNEYLPSLDFEAFRDFFSHFEIEDERFEEILDPLGDMPIEQLILLLEEEYDIISIARKIGVRRLFTGSNDVHENNFEENRPESMEKVWNGIKSNGSQSTDDQVSSEEKTPREKPGNVKKISTVFTEYIEEMVTAKIWNPKSELEKRASLNGLVEIIGDLPINKLSFDIGRAYKQTLMKLPANRNKKAQYRDLKIEEIIKLENVKPMSVRTVNNNLATVIGLINWARKNGYVKENYFEGLKLPSAKKAQDERKPFTGADLKKIFDPDVYQRETDGNDYRYWVPLLGLFTGARINEICQLHVSDIKKEDGLWCLDINDESKDPKNPKKLKNLASARVIPIHPQLVELGFINFVQKQRESKQVRIFPELTLRIDGFYRKPGR
jgi:uncharacterized protein DUF6538